MQTQRGVPATMTNEATRLPRVGDPAPDFRLPSTEGRNIALSDYRGKQAVVLYFYPKDDTPGCTKEACAFRDLRGEFNAAGAEILGVSTDPLDSHHRFRTKYGLQFPLLADEDHAVQDRYGAWGPKTVGDRTFTGTLRSTYLIDRNGVIRGVYPNVTVDGHADVVLAAVRDLAA
jgi:peroxiredoxin Q/BCP